MSLQKKAKARILKWKKALKKGHEIAKITGVTESTISRVSRGLPGVSDKVLAKIVNAKE